MAPTEDRDPSLPENKLTSSGVNPLSVSIIIAAYNAAKTIAETLQSVQSQTYPHWEVIVIDDGSSDNTIKIVQKSARKDERIRVIGQPHGRQGPARNRGILLARYEWLLFLDADDWISTSHLERMTSELSANPELDAIHSGSARVAADGTQVIETYEPPTGDLFPVLARRAAFPNHACIVRKSLVEAVGKFDDSFQKSEDWDLWQRVARTGAKFGAVRDVLAFYRMRPNASSLDNAELLLSDGLRILKQGHSADPRVQDPHPHHENGLPANQAISQKFYLLCWCAGLLLGGGKDARSLLSMVKDDHYAELDSDAVAQCIFDSASLPTCRPPQQWDELAREILDNTHMFLAALEDQSKTAGLAGKADLQLRKKILAHSPLWEQVISQYELEIKVRQERIEEQITEHVRLQNDQSQLHEERNRLHLEIHSLEGRWNQLQQELQSSQEAQNQLQQTLQSSQEERNQLQQSLQSSQEERNQLQQSLQSSQEERNQLQQSLQSSQEERNQLQRTLQSSQEERNQLLKERSALENERNALIHERSRLQKELGASQQELHTSQARIDELVNDVLIKSDSIRLLDQRSGQLQEQLWHWQEVAEDFKTILSKLKKNFWVKMLRRARLLKIPPRKSSDKQFPPLP